MRSDKTTTPTTIRLRRETTRRLQRLAHRYHVDRSTLMRQAITEKVGEWEKAGVVALQSK